MFSPAARSVRREILQNVFELDPPTQPHHDTLETLDLETLAEDEEDIFHELQELEESFEMYFSVPFHPSSASFTASPQCLSASDPQSVLGSLSPSDPESQYIMHRIRGLQGLLPGLRALECSHLALIAQRDDLIAAINSEISGMLLDLWREREMRTSTAVETLGLRRVPVGHQPINRYASPLVTSAIVLTAIAHAVMGIARTNCNFILASLRAIIAMTSRLHDDGPAKHIQQHLSEIPTTLPTALYRLNLSPKFDMYSCCPECSALYPQPKDNKLSIPNACIARNLDGIECGAALSTTHNRGSRVWQKSISRYSHMRFETWISELLLRPGLEDLLEATRPNPNPGPVATDVWDAPYLRTFLHCVDPTFMNPPACDLSLVLMLHFDFFNPFTNKTSGKVRSIGCFFIVCLNLPADVRYNASNAYLVSMVPGPSEVKAEHLHRFIKPIVDDLLEVFSPGIWVSKTHKYPRGRRVQAAVAIKSMDIPASRGAGGFATHGHTCFCHLCSAKRAQIDCTNLSLFQLRTIEAHRQIVSLWESASSLTSRQKVFEEYGVRHIDWLRFAWWNPFDSIVVGPMHWTKNIIDKHLRKNMNWSWNIQAGIPDNRPTRIQPVTTLEYDWGTCALLTLNERDFKNCKLTAPLVHYLCRQRKIFEAGLSSERLINDLNNYRRMHNIISNDGEVTESAKKRFGELFQGRSATLARAHYHVTKASATVASVVRESSRNDLATLCQMLNLADSGVKAELATRLLAHYENILVPNMPDVSPTGTEKQTLSLLGAQVLAEVKADMARTILPSWLKHPPLAFATASHGKLQAEEYKSLTLVSFTITLVRLWGKPDTAPEHTSALENFLHLMISVRILAYQSITDSDITAFELHYMRYLEELKQLYPWDSFTPVQHLGLHIPKFLRSLGPSTRYSESTCEQFIGMFQNISTNFKFGDLELTLHREFVMASRLKGMVEQQGFTDSLQEFGQVVEDFLHRHIPSQCKHVWHTTHGRDPLLVPKPLCQYLATWSKAHHGLAFPTRVYHCTSMRLGNVVYAPHTSSNGNSCIIFSTDNEQPLPGRIEYILEEPPITPNHKPRIVLVVHTFQQLSPEDSLRDPYFNNRIIGHSGAALAKLYYNKMCDGTYLIEPRNLISHAVICQYVDTGGEGQKISRSCIVVLSLDLKHARFA